MIVPFNCLAVNYPNIPVLRFEENGELPFGRFLETSQCDADTELVDVKTQDMYVSNFSLRAIEGKFSRDAILINRDGEGSDLLGSCLFLKGKVKSVSPGDRHCIEAFQGQQNFKYDPENHFHHIVPADKPFHFLHFSYTPQFLNTILPDKERWADELRSKIANGHCVLGENPTAITWLQERALQTIFDNPLDGKLGLVLLETAMIQIILIQLNGLFRERALLCNHKLQKRDVQIIHDVKDYLGNSFLDDHSISNLSMHFGLNTNKLMTAFKKLFGKSIFGYIQDLRMQHARQLLLEHDLQVTEVARTIGYKNPNHFSAAFKRQFGYCPSAVR